MCEFNYGEKVLVRDHENQEWYKRIFIAKHERDSFRCVTSGDENNFENGGKFNTTGWRIVKKIETPSYKPYTLDTFPRQNSGKLQNKIKNSYLYHQISSVEQDGIFLCNNVSHLIWEKALKNYVWFNDDGTTSPFGVLEK